MNNSQITYSHHRASPLALAVRMVELARIQPGDRVLEPTAGDGLLLSAMRAAVPTNAIHLHAFASDPAQADALRVRYPHVMFHRGAFLASEPKYLGGCNAILMMPPTAHGADVKHVSHALRFLAPGGRLVALMARGVRGRLDRRTVAFRAAVAMKASGGHYEVMSADDFEGDGLLLTLTQPLTAPAAAVAGARISA